MSGCFTRSAIDGQILFDPVKGIDLGGGKDWQAHPACQFERLGTVGGDTNGRVRLLNRLRHNREVLNVKKTPAVGKLLLGPCLAHYLQPFQEALAVLRLWNSETGEMLGELASADTEFNAAVADYV